VWLAVLGPVECRVDGRPVSVSGQLNRALLAALAVDAERVSDIDELVDALWGEAPPAAAGKVVRNRVSLLRGMLTSDFIQRVGRGYRLAATVDIDLRQFLNEGGSASERLALWRGVPFAEIGEWPPARAVAVRLGDLRAHLEEVALAEQLQAGANPNALVGAAEQLVDREPFREHRWALLMRALYLAGRQRDALDAFQRARRMLREELGLRPGSELVAAERSILNDEPSPERPPSATPSRGMPSGTVTFLFTDVEGSTRLWAADPDAMSASLAVHDAVLRDAIESGGGYIFATAGDSFAAAFTRASDAVRASCAAQAALDDTVWPGPALRVRMGMHIGEAEERAGDYFGPAVNTAARVAAAGHGGQVLVTELVRVTAAVTSATDLGVHRVRDVPDALRLFQLGERHFPPLRVVDRGQSNLPVRPTQLFGRENDVSTVRRLLATNRLVTVTAVGGAGKTRLAIAVGEAELPHRSAGVWLADLTATVNGVDVPAAIAKAIGLTLRDGDPTDQVTAYLVDKATLVILDNCEHVIDACASFAEAFLRVAGAAVILATSREALDVEGERTMVLGPLASDGPPSPGVQLFVDRATAVDPLFELTDTNASTVATLCTRLDGLPLAIELAAARVSVMTPAELLAGLDDRFQLLARGRRRQRQRTLEATLDWSYDLLDPEEQQVLRALGVFVDGFDVDAVAAVTKSPRRSVMAVVEALVAKSLVVRIEPHEPARFRLLETVKAYAEDRLRDAGEAVDVRDKHLEHFGRVAGVHGRTMFGELRLGVRLRADRSNITSAFEWGVGAGRWIEAGELLVGAHTAYVFDGSLLELKTLIERAIEPCQWYDQELADYLRTVSLPTLSWLGDHGAYVHHTRELTTSSVASIRIFAWLMQSYLATAADAPEARALLARGQSELESTPLPPGDRNLGIVAGMMAYIPAALAAYDDDPASALRHAEHALAVEARNDYRTVQLLSGTQLAAACEIVLGEPARALARLGELNQFELAFFTGDEVRALAYLALGERDQAERIIQNHARQAVTGQISAQAGDSLLLLAALADAEGDARTATELLLRMGVGHHASTRMYSVDLAARLGVAGEHATMVRDALAPDGRRRSSATDAVRVVAALRRELARRGWLAPPTVPSSDQRGRAPRTKARSSSRV
jgi:predicted ATPase/class 3 adenylate cyclase